jgi:fucose permease
LGLVLRGAAAGSKLWDSFLGMLFLEDFTLDLAVIAATVLITKMLQRNSEVKL